MWQIERIKRDLEQTLSEQRYFHSLRTAEVAKNLAKHYGYQEEKAYVTALVHDIAKEYSEEQMQRAIQKYHLKESLMLKENKKFAHGFIGAEIAREKYQFNKEMYQAIAYHTTGRKDMGLLEKIVTLADKIEPGKNYMKIEEERVLAFKSLEKALLFCLENKIEKLKRKKESIHPQTLETKKFLEEQIEQQKKKA